MYDERIQILGMVESGQITAEDAVILLKALDASPEGDSPPSAEPEAGSPHGGGSAPERGDPPPIDYFAPDPEDNPEGARSAVSAPRRPFRKFWLIPLWVGAAITVLGGLLMFSAWQNGGFGFWFACAWFPFTIGILFLILAWAARGTPWLHLRVRQKEGSSPRNIVISFPLPLRLAGWLLRTFRKRIPGLENTNIDEIILALEHISPENPFSIEVDEGNGEHVEIYIG